MTKVIFETTTGAQAAQWSAQVQFAEVQEPVDIERDADIESIVAEEIDYLPHASVAWIWGIK
ncbi:MAG: hypothetical protein ACO23H_11640 [Alphaproteobacteria bacterium]